MGVLLYLLGPGLRASREAARRTHCNKHLKILGLALHNYSDFYGSLPPAYVADENGKRMHSWRVLILPYLDRADLYAAYRFDEPWDGPNNSKLADQMPYLFRCPSSVQRDGMTNYQCVTGPGTAFPGAHSVALSEITDGVSHTLLVTEVDRRSVHWMQPKDIPLDKAYQFLQDRAHTGGVHMLLCDGSVKFLNENVNAMTYRHLLTIRDGHLPGEF